MKKIIILFISILVLLCSTNVAYAIEPYEDLNERQVTVQDTIEVMDQIKEYEDEINILAQLVYAEARGVDSTMEQAAVIWCVLNRVDSDTWSDEISEVVKQRSQFAYSSSLPVKDEFRDLAQDVIIRWLLEKRGVMDVGRVLPNDYCYFAGRNGRNWFRKEYESRSYWSWDVEDPYAINEAQLDI